LLVCGYLSLTSLLAEPAAGQLRRVLAPRGSEGPSTQLGIVGGYYTATSYDPMALGSRSAYSMDYGFTSVPRFRAGMTRPLGSVPQALLPARPALVPARGRYATLGMVDSNALRDISGLSLATSVFNSPRGWMPGDYLRLSAPPVLPNVEDSVYHQFFRLEPAPRDRPLEPAGPQPEVSAAQLYEAIHETDVNMMTDRAVRLFREATQAEVVDRTERLSQAQDALTSILYINPYAQTPALLCVFLALEREQIHFAMNKLLQAVQRNPDLFRERPDLAQYFGDPKLLTAQLRKFALGDEAFRGNAASLAIQAYCAWLLDDIPRVRGALEAAARAAEGSPLASSIELLDTAMRAGIPGL
jgi:hypothetical protein